jgi:glycosyltransferase involved in cell wall biosynthesis
VKALDALVTHGVDDVEAPSDVLVIGTVARFDAVKGLEVLLRAVQRLPGVTLVLVGGGAEESRLRADAAVLGLGDRVRFLGIGDGAPRLFRGWAMFVSASRREGLPLAILEAMACRLPVVASDVAGHREVVVPGTTGVLVPPDDPATLASAIARLLADGALRQRMGDAGRTRVVQHFDVGPMVTALGAVYRAAVTADDAGRRG